MTILRSRVDPQAFVDAFVQQLTKAIHRTQSLPLLTTMNQHDAILEASADIESILKDLRARLSK